MNLKIALAQLFLRLSLGIGFLVPGLDRLGVWGPNGGTNISWGDWQHFSKYAHELMFFLPYGIAEVFAIIATAGELLFGALLIAGWYTKYAAIGSAILTLCFALCMAVSSGIVSPLSYSVFTVSAASFLLSTIKEYKWSIDEKNANQKSIHK